MSVPKMHAHYMGLAGRALQTTIAVTAGLCFVGYGFGQGDIGGLMIQTTFREQFPSFDATGNPGNLTVANKSGAVVAAWNIGCLVGAGIVMFTSDWLGRRGCIQAGIVIELIGKIIQASSFGVGQYVAGRVIAGVGNGFITATIPAWQAETLKTHRRGTVLLVSFGACISLGTAISYWLVYAFAFAQPSSASWRTVIALSMLFLLPALGLITFMPESPRWLLLQAREQEAIRVLSALNELPEDSEDVRREVLQIKYAVKHMAGAPIGQLFKNGDYRYLHRTLLAILLQVMQQFTGINLFIQYLGSMFANQLRFEMRESMLLAACCSSEFFLAGLFAVFAIDRLWGRRTLTMFGASGMCLSMVLLAILDYVGLHNNGMRSAFYAMTAFLFLYNTCFSIGWQGMSWMWAVELIPLTIRGPANALATGANWLSNFIVVLVTPTMFTTITWRTYVVFAVFNLVFVPVIYFLYPETGGRSLEEVDSVFKSASESGKNPWIAVVRAAKLEPRWFDKNGDPTDSYGGGSSGSDLEKQSSSSEGKSPDAAFKRAAAAAEEGAAKGRKSWEPRDAAPRSKIPVRTMRRDSEDSVTAAAVAEERRREEGTPRTSSDGALPPPDVVRVRSSS